MSTNLARHVSRSRAERLVAHARLVAHVAVSVAAGIGAARSGNVAPVVLAGSWTLLSAMAVWRMRRSGKLPAVPLLLAGDLVVAGCLIVMTGGGVSPFFPFLFVPAFAASVLYGRRALMWSAAGMTAVYIALSLLVPSELQVEPFVVRLGLLIVLWFIVVRRADHEERTTADLEQLAGWPRLATDDRERGVRELLEHAAAALRSPRVTLTWREAGGTCYAAHYDTRDGTFGFDEEEHDGRNGTDATHGTQGNVLRADFESRTVNGTLSALGAAAADEDDARLAQIVARLVSSGLDQLHLMDVLRERATAGERLRLSRDLHDGLLQTLGGIALHAQTARRVVTRDPRVAEERLELIVTQLTEGQRSLRDFVDDLRPELTLRREALHARLGRLAQSIALQWDVAIQLDAERAVDAIEGRAAEDVVALVAEALTNAAKHAEARRIEGCVTLAEGAVCIDVRDDGRGFPFHGRRELAELVEAGEGPWSLKERIRALGGALTIESSAHGSRVALRVPHVTEGAS
ncbi:MAG TPA: histidine kinase [Thermoanaerobaculia bacterium]